LLLVAAAAAAAAVAAAVELQTHVTNLRFLPVTATHGKKTSLISAD
jgi:hypothetical protein